MCQKRNRRCKFTIAVFTPIIVAANYEFHSPVEWYILNQIFIVSLNIPARPIAMWTKTNINLWNDSETARFIWCCQMHLNDLKAL